MASDTFCIVPIGYLDTLDFSTVKDTSIDTVRRSIDGTHAVIFWEGDPPPGIEWPTYSLAEIQQIMAGCDWSILDIFAP
jgi:hypothetical protein